ncbi:MAG: hypothetical protein ABWX74_12830 [Aeromicrobium sp.]
MFEATATEDLLREVRAHDFDADPVLEVGHNRVEAIREIDRGIRALQAEQVHQIGALYAERAVLMGLGQGDPGLAGMDLPLHGRIDCSTVKLVG